MGLMSVRRETELKYRLEGRAEYEKLCRELGDPEDAWEQINHYFQSADGKIPGEDGVIRIRQEKGRAVLTVKLGALANGLARAREYEQPWSGPWHQMPPRSKALWESRHEGLEVLERRFGGRFPLVWAGRMVNLRKLYRSVRGLCMEVDASRYPDGQEDYEVEVETESPERDRALLEALLRDLGIGFVPQTATKYQRFLRHPGPPDEPRPRSRKGGR
jgi:uncharacterized protein YjbK